MGSSPLARGTSQVTHLISLEVRLIPARAGSTKLTPVTPAVSAAHPRSRGEHPSPGSPEITIDGSSPLARGTHWVAAEVAGPAGLIPARAGNTGRLQKAVASRWAHPRSRGEHKVTPYAPCFCSGSSPLARGPPIFEIKGMAERGLIPARAGNTVYLASYVLAYWAHPRSRGDHAPVDAVGDGERGSSPLARGPHYNPIYRIQGKGLIPARAGTTARPSQ